MSRIEPVALGRRAEGRPRPARRSRAARPRSSDAMEQDRVGPVEPDEPERLGPVERLALEPAKPIVNETSSPPGRPRCPAASSAKHRSQNSRAGTYVYAHCSHREPRSTPRSRSAVKNASPATPGVYRCPTGKSPSHRRTRPGGRSSRARITSLLGRKYAMSRIEPVRSPTGFHTASTAMPIVTSSGATSPSMCRNPPSEPSIAITAGISGSASGSMSHRT